MVFIMAQRLVTPDQLGQLLAARRKALKLSQGRLAERIGISQNRLSELETDPARLTFDRLLELTNALGLELTLQEKERERQPDASQGEW